MTVYKARKGGEETERAGEERHNKYIDPSGGWEGSASPRTRVYVWSLPKDPVICGPLLSAATGFSQRPQYLHERLHGPTSPHYPPRNG